MTQYDAHADLAKMLFGVVNTDTRSRAKAINYMEAYGCGQIKLGKLAGQYPVRRSKP